MLLHIRLIRYFRIWRIWVWF